MGKYGYKSNTQARVRPFYKICISKHMCHYHEFKLRTVFLSNSAQILISCKIDEDG